MDVIKRVYGSDPEHFSYLALPAALYDNLLAVCLLYVQKLYIGKSSSLYTVAIHMTGFFLCTQSLCQCFHVIVRSCQLSGHASVLFYANRAWHDRHVA